MSLSKTPLFEINDLHVRVQGKEILKGVQLTVNPGEVHAIMGRNGSGKTTLSYTLMGHPKYEITRGQILLNGEDITQLSPHERAKKRMFLAFQYPISIPGVTVANFLRSSIRAVRGEELPAKEVRKLIQKEAAAIGVPESFLTRSLNEGFSGGEKKRLETLQMKLLDPQFMILDETDSGLDIDALRIVAQTIESQKNESKSTLLITHYQRILDYVKPDFVHVFLDGTIAKTGDAGLALDLEKRGYDWVSNG